MSKLDSLLGLHITLLLEIAFVSLIRTQLPKLEGLYLLEKTCTYEDAYHPFLRVLFELF